MGEARQAMDAMTEAMVNKDSAAAAKLYAPDAVAITPDQGELTGREPIAQYVTQPIDAFPDATYESVYGHESGDTAVDEGYFVGTNTEPLAMPTNFGGSRAGLEHGRRATVGPREGDRCDVSPTRRVE